MGAAADCEAIAAGILGQPVNTVTTLAFVVAGSLVMARRRDLVWLGAALVLTGIGSFLFHGPMPPGAEWAHDVSLAWLILVIAGIGWSRERLTRLPGLILLGGLFALAPTVADPIAVGLTILAVIVLVRRDRTISTLGPLLLVGVTGVVGRLGATGGPLCNPESLLQPHGLWHLGAATAVTWWALAFTSPKRLWT